MHNILFICHGNICRSPMAEFIFKDMLQKSGREKEFYVESAAVSREEIGNDIYPPAQRELSRHNIQFEHRYARQMTKEDYEKFDRIYVMDKSNIRLMYHIIGEDKDNKVMMLLDRDVTDPWYYGNFDKTYDDIVLGCGKILEEL